MAFVSIDEWDNLEPTLVDNWQDMGTFMFKDEDDKWKECHILSTFRDGSVCVRRVTGDTSNWPRVGAARINRINRAGLRRWR